MSARPLFLGLGLLASALATALSLELNLGQPAEDATGIVPVRHVPKAQPRVASEDPEDHIDAWVATALARPLFSRDRKPTPAAPKGGGPALSSLPRLTGVVVGSFGRIAIFASGGDQKPIAVSEGKTLGPYRVQTIVPGSVTVTGPDGERVVSLTADAATRQALEAEMPQQPQVVPGQPPGILPGVRVPGLPNGAMPRPNLRPGMQFQRGLPPGVPRPRSIQDGSDQ
jgi:hypothetical protein